MSKQIYVLALLLFVTAVQAAPDDLPAHGEGSVVFTPAARPRFTNLDPQPGGNFDVRNEPRNNSRYGIGYDARHGNDTGAGNPGIQSQQGNRPSPGMNQSERPQQPAQSNPSAGARRGARGR